MNRDEALKLATQIVLTQINTTQLKYPLKEVMEKIEIVADDLQTYSKIGKMKYLEDLDI